MEVKEITVSRRRVSPLKDEKYASLGVEISLSAEISPGEQQNIDAIADNLYQRILEKEDQLLGTGDKQKTF